MGVGDGLFRQAYRPLDDRVLPDWRPLFMHRHVRLHHGDDGARFQGQGIEPVQAVQRHQEQHRGRRLDVSQRRRPAVSRPPGHGQQDVDRGDDEPESSRTGEVGRLHEDGEGCYGEGELVPWETDRAHLRREPLENHHARRQSDEESVWRVTGDPADDREHHRGRATEPHHRDEIESDRAAPILPQRYRQPVEQGAVGDRPVPEPLVQVQPPRIGIAGATQYEQRRRDEADERGDHQGERRIREAVPTVVEGS